MAVRELSFSIVLSLLLLGTSAAAQSDFDDDLAETPIFLTPSGHALIEKPVEAGPVSEEAAARPSVPSGFEELAEPHEVWVDVYFRYRLLTQTSATATPDTLTFSDPAALVRLMPELTDPDAVQKALTGLLENHGSKSCHPVAIPGCGELDVAVAGIIYSQDGFRVDVVVAPSLMASENILGQYLPPPNAGLTHVTQLAAAYSTTFSPSTPMARHYQAVAYSLTSYNQTHLDWAVSSSDKSPLVLDRLVAEHQRDQWLAQGGLFPVTDLATIRTPEIAGAGLGTNLRTRLDLGRAYGTPLILYLSQPSRVSLYVDDRLYSGRQYDAGPQELDQTELPNGSYNVTIDILGANGEHRVETRFFVKARSLPPVDTPLIWSAAGVVRRPLQGTRSFLPEFTHVPMVAGGFARRLRTNLSLSADLLVSPPQSLTELGVIAQLPKFGVSLDTLFSDRGHAGIAALVFGQFMGAQLQASARATSAPNASFALRGLAAPSDYSFIDPRTVQLDLSAAYAFESVTAGLAGSYRSTEDTEDQFTIAGTARAVIYKGVGLRASVNARLAYESAGPSGILSVSFDADQEQWVGQGAVGLSSRDVPYDKADYVQEINGDSHLWWRDNDLLRDDLRAGAAASYHKNAGSARLSSVYGSDYGRAEANVSYAAANTTVDATVRATVLASADGIAAGGRDDNLGGIIVEVEGGPDDVFELVINNVTWGTLPANRRIPIPLSPYASYNVRPVGTAAEQTEFDADSQTVIIYPGNVYVLSWKSTPVVILLGTLVTPNGTPIGEAQVRGSRETTRSDAEGFFQISTPVGAALEVRSRDGSSCSFDAPTLPGADGVIEAGKVTCSLERQLAAGE